VRTPLAGQRPIGWRSRQRCMMLRAPGCEDGWNGMMVNRPAEVD